MSFYGASFSYNGRACEEYGLMLYDFDTTAQGASKFAAQELNEERIAGKHRTLFYDARYKKPLEFKLVFGAGEYEANAGDPIDRYEMQQIAAWLTDQREYHWLVIDQPDMEGVRYRCIMTGLEMVEFAGKKWAFACTAHCDSPYGYLLPQEFTFQTAGDDNPIALTSRSTINGLYYPLVRIELLDGNSFSIVNESAGDREFALTDLPSGSGEITVDGERGLLYCDAGLNLYQGFNFTFPALVKGDNRLRVNGTGNLTFHCEFPVNIGG